MENRIREIAAALMDGNTPLYVVNQMFNAAVNAK